MTLIFGGRDFEKLWVKYKDAYSGVAIEGNEGS